jgi:hypothetical protein
MTTNVCFVGARALGLLLLLALLGGAAGWAWAEQTSDPPISRAVPEQPAAQKPAIPFTPPEKTRPDSDLPPLPVGIASHDEKLGPAGLGEGGVVVPIPNGWERSDFADGLQARWTAPGNPPGSYSLRVQIVDLPRSLEQMVAARAAELPFDDRISALEIPAGQTGDTLRATFIIDGYRRLQITRWLSFDGNGIDLEISATGRLIDERGLEALVAKVATEAYRQNPIPRKGSLATPRPTDD